MTEEGTESPGGSAPGPNPLIPTPPITPRITPPCQWPPPPPPPPGPPTPWPAAPPACWLPRSTLFSVCIRVIYRRGGREQGGMTEWRDGHRKGEGGGQPNGQRQASIITGREKGSYRASHYNSNQYRGGSKCVVQTCQLVTC